MKFTNSHGVTIGFTPWFDNGYRFTYLHLYEELGGKIAYGEMAMEFVGKDEALKLITDQHTGELTIETDQSDTPKYTIPVFIVDISHDKNFANIQFICVGDKNFGILQRTSTWNDIEKAVKGLYPGKVDIRCETDIQAKDIKYYQNDETDQEFLSRLCYSFKKNCVFTFGWEGFMMKETMGKYDSRGNIEPKLQIHGDSDFTQVSTYSKPYDPSLYTPPIDIWSNTEEPIVAIKDYTEVKPVNPQVLYKYGSMSIIHSKYYQLEENWTYNTTYLNSSMFQEITITHHVIPKFKIGDALYYMRDNLRFPESAKLPYKYYLVRSNEFFIALDGSQLSAPDGSDMLWTTRLLGLEENGSIALGKTEDPTDTTEE